MKSNKILIVYQLLNIDYIGLENATDKFDFSSPIHDNQMAVVTKLAF